MTTWTTPVPRPADPHSDALNRIAVVQERIRARTIPDGDCWHWQGHIPPDGYGRISIDGRQWLAHRASYTAFVGEIPDGLNMDHLCRNRWCVNPEHLEPVTQSENLKRSPLMGRQASKTHCPKGHPYDESNTAHRNGRRHCRTCNRERFDVNKHNPIAPCPRCGKQMRRGNIKRHITEVCTRLGLDGDQK